MKVPILNAIIRVMCVNLLLGNFAHNAQRLLAFYLESTDYATLLSLMVNLSVYSFLENFRFVQKLPQ